MLALILILPLVAALLALTSRRIAPWITLITMLAVLLVAAIATREVLMHGLLVGTGGGFTLDALGALYLLLVAFVGVTAALYSFGYLAARHREAGHVAPRYRQYYPMFNLFLAAMLAVPLLSNLAVMWIAIELTTLFSAFLVAYENRVEALEAAWKYVVLTTMGAMIALLGMLVIYYGVHQVAGAPTWAGLVAAAPRIPPAVLLTGFVLALIGFGAKAGLVPMHTWLPDAHSQAPASICALLSGVETSAALYMILRFYPALVRNPGIHGVNTWYLAAGLTSAGAAAFLILNVADFKRLFAYSTVEHMGIILAATGLGTAAAHLGAVSQLFAHALTKSFCFYAAGLAALSLGTQQIRSSRGLLSSSPLAGWPLLLGALAIAGAPPFAVFISELQILRAGFAVGAYLATGLLTVFIVVAFVGILYQIGGIVFREPAPASAPGPALPLSSLVALAIAALPMLIFGFYLPPPLRRLIEQSASLLGATP